MYDHADILNAHFIVENLTRTLLYEGYALYPYHRSAIKNQKPVPFGVVFPQQYNIYNEHAHYKMQTQCIVTGNDNLLINLNVRFLHLKKTELPDHTPKKNAGNDFVPVDDLKGSDNFYHYGWQTIERKVSTGDLQISQLVNDKKDIHFEFNKIVESEPVYDENSSAAVKRIGNASGIKGSVVIGAVPVENMQNSFRVTVTVINTTPVENAEQVTRDEALSQSFLSTHTILETPNAAFISHQNPGEKWEASIEGCENINTWPILIDESNTILLSSPIILYDYPQINPQSSGDLFDSTEIEEALLLHVAVLSDDEKKRIAQSDEKLQAMLNKISQVTPGELINFHSGLKDSPKNQIISEKKIES